jgi:hypothetical protein
VWMSESGALDSLRRDFGTAKPYLSGLRARAIVIVVGGASRHEVAILFEVSFKYGGKLAPALVRKRQLRSEGE